MNKIEWFWIETIEDGEEAIKLIPKLQWRDECTLTLGEDEDFGLHGDSVIVWKDVSEPYITNVESFLECAHEHFL